MKLLALDTATERMAVALADGEVQRGLNAEGGAAASATLLPAILGLLDELGLRPADLDAIAFGRGPGAFTGLRTSVSVAQGLALGIGCPVLAIDSLLIVAEDARRQAAQIDGRPFEIWVAMDARMDEVYAAAYRHEGLWATGWRELHSPGLYDLPSLRALWAAAPPVCVAGSALIAMGDRLPLDDAACFPDTQDRAAALLALARSAWRAGAGLPAEQALPLYLRNKVAQTTAERLAARDARHAALAHGPETTR